MTHFRSSLPKGSHSDRNHKDIWDQSSLWCISYNQDTDPKWNLSRNLNALNLSVRVMFHLASSRSSWFLLWIETKYHLSLATENKDCVCHCVCECLQVNIWIWACLKSPKGSSQGYDEWILQGGLKVFLQCWFSPAVLKCCICLYNIYLCLQPHKGHKSELWAKALYLNEG